MIHCMHVMWAIDVRALRHTFGTLLARSGATVKESQLAMRHSRPELTLNTYVDSRLVDFANAVESLPSLDTPERSNRDIGVMRATGTDGDQSLGEASRKVPPAAVNSGQSVTTGGHDSTVASNRAHEEPGA